MPASLIIGMGIFSAGMYFSYHTASPEDKPSILQVTILIISMMLMLTGFTVKLGNDALIALAQEKEEKLKSIEMRPIVMNNSPSCDERRPLLRLA